MADEKKEEKAVSEPAQKPAEEVKPKVETAPPALTEPQAVREEKKAAPAAKKEKPSNCAACKKPIRKRRWYYRNGKFYCTKKCWKTTLKKEEKPDAAAQPAK